MENLFFSNVGKKIKTIAMVLFVVELIAGAIVGIVLMSGSKYAPALAWTGFGIICGTIFFSYVSSLVLYGFGELVENSKKSGSNSETKEKIVDELPEL